MDAQTISQAKQKKANKASSKAIMPTRRDLNFDLPKHKIKSWNGGDTHLSAFMNTLSVLFPVGERFFIQSVRHFRDHIDEPELKKAVTAFIGQEAMHGREHEEYNQALFDAVDGTEQQEEFTRKLLAFFQAVLPKSTQLSGTIALEHFTAIMADGLLKEPRILEHADPAFAKVWTWHALEETEHKAVAFDVWEKVRGKGLDAYAERVGGLLLATPILLSVVGYYYLRTLKLEGELTNAKGWRSFFNMTVGKIGYVRKLAKPWADYFKPDFHPWDHDNRHYLALLDEAAFQTQQAS